MNWNHERFLELTEGEQSLIKWQYQHHGGFFMALWNAISKADGENLRRLEKGFPSHIEAYRRYGGEKGYWDSLRKFVGIIKEEQTDGDQS